MSILILGGAGFVGLNLAEAFLAKGRHVTVFDRSPPPPSACQAFERLPGRFEAVSGDVTDAAALGGVIVSGVDTLVLGAAVTAGAERDAREPRTVLAVNLASQVPALELARDAGVRRVVNLSSAAAYGAAGQREARLDETVPADPVGLYAVTKFASERVAARLGALWGMDVVSLRLSGVFGPWERATGWRDTLSPHLQAASLAEAGAPAFLGRPGLRDWIYAPDVAEAVVRVVEADRLAYPVYNVSAPERWSVLEWGRLLETAHPGFTCRLARDGEAPTIDLHGPDRAPLGTGRLAAELGWTARFGMASSAEHYIAWRKAHRSLNEDHA